MREEREVAVRIFTERRGFSAPAAEMFGAMIHEEHEEELSLPLEEPSDSAPETGGEEGEDAFSAPQEPAGNGDEDSLPETSEFFAQGKLVETDDRLEIVYEESVLTGMEGSVTSIGFAKNEPEIISMVRSGFVDTMFVFEAGKRHISIYQTPFAEFEFSVYSLLVRNLLLREGIIELDYITELRGARTERCKMKIVIG